MERQRAMLVRHQRAVDKDEKRQRRQQILAAAAELFKTSDYDQVSVLEITRKCSLAKGTFYIYFNTKEELFLALLDESFNAWFTGLKERIPSLYMEDVPARIQAFAELLTNSLQEHDILLRLLPLLHVLLERNIPYPAALAFKQHLRAFLLQTGEQIEQSFSFLRAGQGIELVLSAYAGLIGLQSMAEPSPVARQVLELPEMALFKVETIPALRQMLVRLLAGLWFENERNK
jgi:TetR/AcrR family transcriptional regulator